MLTMRVARYAPEPAATDGDAFILTIAAQDCAAWPPHVRLLLARHLRR
jgi:hypothetical protein